MTTIAIEPSENGRILRDGRRRVADLERDVADLRQQADQFPGPEGRAVRARLRAAETDLGNAREILKLAESAGDQARAARDQQQKNAIRSVPKAMAELEANARRFDALLAEAAGIAVSMRDGIEALSPLVNVRQFPGLFDRRTLHDVVASSALGPLVALPEPAGSSRRSLSEHYTARIRPTINEAVAAVQPAETAR